MRTTLQDWQRAATEGNRVIREALGNAKQPVFSHTEGPGSDLNGVSGTLSPIKQSKRLKQGLVKMNHLEREFLLLIKDKFPDHPPVRSQLVTFTLAPGLRYTPDFYCASWPDMNWERYPGCCHSIGPSAPTAFEVKGRKSWDDAICKIKMAKTIFPEINWWFCDKHNGVWRWQRMI